MLGALDRWKRPDLALEVCAIARRRRPGPAAAAGRRAARRPTGERLAPAARPRARPDLAGAVESAGRGATIRAADLARATCLLHCAPREPFGLVVLEALAAGRPVVVPDAGGPAEIVDAALRAAVPARRRAGGGRGAHRSCSTIRARARATRARRARAGPRAVRRSTRPRAGSRRSVSCVQLAAAGAARARRRRTARRSSPSPTTPRPSSAALLDSVARHLPGARMVVVDCASADDSVAVARARAGSVDVIALERERRLRRAPATGGSTRCPSTVTALSTPMSSCSTTRCWSWPPRLRARTPARLLAPLVLYADGSPPGHRPPAPGSAADLVRALVPPSVAPGRAGEALAPWRASGRRARGLGGGLRAGRRRTDTLRRLGPFDETIFLYGEDLELGLRAARAGVDLVVALGPRRAPSRALVTRAAFGGEPFERLARARHDVVARRLGRRRARLTTASRRSLSRSRIVIKRAPRPARWRASAASWGRMRSRRDGA